MNKSDLISAMAEKAELTKVDAKRALDAFIETVGEQLSKGETIALIGFGTFSVAERPEHEGLNPATKKRILIPAKKVVKFKVGSALTDKVQ